MKQLSLRALAATGTRDNTTFLRGDGTWAVPSGPGGGSTGGVVLLDAGVTTPPSSTTVGTIGFQKAVSRDQAILNDGPACFLKLDETSGNWLDASGNNRGFIPGTGVVRGKAPLVADGGFAAAGSGTANVGNYSGATGMTANGVSMEFVARIPATIALMGGFMKVGTPGTGWAISIGGARDTAGYTGRNLIIGQNGISWRVTGYTFPAEGGIFHICVTWDTGNTVRTYLNGSLIITNTGWGSPIAVGNALYAGEDESSYLSSSIDIDNLAWFPTVLSADQIGHHAGVGSGKPLGWWDGANWQPLA